MFPLFDTLHPPPRVEEHGKYPLQRMFWIIPFQYCFTCSYTMHVFLTACTVSLTPLVDSTKIYSKVLSESFDALLNGTVPMLLIILYNVCNILYCVVFGFSPIVINWLIVPEQLLKSLLVHREKCTVKMPLTRQQLCAVLSGLKDAKKLKELIVSVYQMVCLVT